MSGPKGYGYRVISEEEGRRRDAAARQVRCAKLISRIKGLIGTSAHLGITCSFPQDIADRTAYSAEDERSLAQRADELELAIDGVYRARRISKMKAELAEMIQNCKYPGSVSSAESYIEAAEEASPNEEAALLRALYLARHDIKLAEAKSVAEAVKQTYDLHPTKLANGIFSPAPERKAAEESLFLEKLQIVANAISEIRDDGNREAARERLAHLANLPDDRLAQGELLSLENWLHSVLEGEGWARLASDAVAKIEHVSSPLAEHARALSAGVSTRCGYEELEVAIDNALSEHNRVEDAAYVQSALREALESLGFTMGDPFAITDFGEVGIALHPSTPGYGLRIQNNPNSSQILTRVVSCSETEPDQDVQAERDACPMVHSLAAAMEGQGIDMRLMNEKKPGECRVEHYSEWQSGTRSVGSKKAVPARERVR